MDESNTEGNRVSLDEDEMNRGLQLPSFYYSGFSSAVSVFCLGVTSGAVGGLLLGTMSIIVLQSLELLADNRPLMDQLERYPLKDNQSQWSSKTNISMLATEFGVSSSTLSLAAGIFVGLSTYVLVVKKYDQTKTGKALTVAGPVCFMVVTVVGCVSGLTFQHVLIFTVVPAYLYLTLIILYITIICCFAFCNFHSTHTTPFLLFFFTPAALCFSNRFWTTNVFAFLPSVVCVHQLEGTYNFKSYIAISVVVMLLISDAFHFTGQSIVTLEAPTSRNASSAVVESIFIGIVTTQLWVAAIGASLFVGWHSGGVWKICASAASLGGAVLSVLKGSLPALGPGPTIGGLMGVAGAVGVTLAAAKEATDNYGQVVECYGVVGKFGVIIGAAVGAYLNSCSHSGLSGWFIALCAATIPAGVCLEPLLRVVGGKVLHQVRYQCVSCVWYGWN